MLSLCWTGHRRLLADVEAEAVTHVDTCSGRVQNM
jgi:hypothetical protein